MSDFKHMINEEDIGSGENKASENKELIEEIKKIPVNGGAPINNESSGDAVDPAKTTDAK